MKSKMAKKVITKVTHKESGNTIEMEDLECGWCGSELYGYDEEICPSCSGLNDFSEV
jgi:hypothetical protein